MMDEEYWEHVRRCDENGKATANNMPNTVNRARLALDPLIVSLEKNLAPYKETPNA